MKAILALGLCFTLRFFDAVHCGVAVCSTSQFSCTLKKCISYKLQCNGIDDCGDNSDELNCERQACSNNQHNCDSWRCFSLRDVCDGITDCVDESDEQFCSCGQSQGSSQDSNIVGGTTVSDSSNWPWMAAIITVSSDGTAGIKCGGTLISRLHVLTAAHCFDPKFTELTKDDLKVRLAENDFLTTDDSQHLDFSIAEVRMHEQFNNENLVNDIAVIRLNREAVFSKYISKSCLLPENIDLTGKSGYILGWGRRFHKAPVSSKLQIAGVPVWDQKSCIEAYQNERSNFTVSPQMMCAGNTVETKISYLCLGFNEANVQCTALGHEFRRCTCNEGFYPIEGDACNGCADPCTDFHLQNAVCEALDSETRKCSCNTGFHPFRGDACNCDDPCQYYTVENAICSATDAETPECKCNPNFFPIEEDACLYDCTDPCSNFLSRNNVCVAVSYDNHTCLCQQGYFPLFKEVPCDGCLNPCDTFRGRNAICTPKSSTSINCECEEGLFPMYENDVCAGCKTLVCPSGYQHYSGYFGCLKVHQEKKVSMESARKTCQSEGGDLYSPGDILPVLPKNELNLETVKFVGYWVGLRRTSTDGSLFKRLSDGAVRRDNSPIWSSGNPSRSDNNAQCVLYVGPFDSLGDYRCSFGAYFIAKLHN